MRRLTGYRAGGAVLLAVSVVLCVRPVRADADAFTRLFDGKSLDDWEGNLEWFRVEKKAIVGGKLDQPIPQNEFLCTRQSYSDFELRLQVKIVGDQTNAGIQVRSRRIPDHHEMVGYQADVGHGWWGKLYDESRRNRVLAGPDDQLLERIVKKDAWNDYRIRCQGRRIQLWINGRQTVDYTEADESIPQDGLIGLQIHSGPPGEAWYREIRIRELGE